MWPINFQMFKLDLEKAEEFKIKLPTSVGSSKNQENSRKTSISASLTMPNPLCKSQQTVENSSRDGNIRPPTCLHLSSAWGWTVSPWAAGACLVAQNSCLLVPNMKTSRVGILLLKPPLAVTSLKIYPTYNESWRNVFLKMSWQRDWVNVGWGRDSYNFMQSTIACISSSYASCLISFLFFHPTSKMPLHCLK